VSTPPPPEPGLASLWRAALGQRLRTPFERFVVAGLRGGGPSWWRAFVVALVWLFVEMRARAFIDRRSALVTHDQRVSLGT
jgi:hypothetical protein